MPSMRAGQPMECLGLLRVAAYYEGVFEGANKSEFHETEKSY